LFLILLLFEVSNGIVMQIILDSKKLQLFQTEKTHVRCCSLLWQNENTILFYCKVCCFVPMACAQRCMPSQVFLNVR